MPSCRTVCTQTSWRSCVKGTQVKPVVCYKKSYAVPTSKSVSTQASPHLLNAATNTEEHVVSPHLDYVYANNINRPEHVSIPQSQMEKENVSDTLQMDEEPSSESDDSVSSPSPSPLDPEYIPSDSSSDEDVVIVHAIKSSCTEIPECEESEERNFFVYEECLKSLFVKCPMCDKRIMNTTFQCRGTLLLVSYTCQAGHAGVWYSQPMVDGMAAGNLRLSCAVLFCGLTYDRVKELLLTVLKYVTNVLLISWLVLKLGPNINITIQ